MKKYLDNKTRIKLKWSLYYSGHVLALQRKKWWGWKMVSAIYPSIMENKSCKHIIEWLLWDEDETFRKSNKSDIKIGHSIMNRCCDEFKL